MIKKQIFTILSAGVFLLNTAAVHAQQAPAQPITADCSLSKSDLAAIQAIQNDPTLTFNQELNQELNLRKQLLSGILSCATLDAQNLQSQVNTISTSDGGTTIKSQLSGKISDALTFYGIESTKLTNAGIKGTETIAKETLSWRTANYIPLEGDVNNLLLWSENQNLFQTAQNRLKQTQGVVAFIEAATQNGALQASLGKAQSSLENAQSENTTAENSLAQFQPPDQSLSLIKESLQALSDTYQKFSDLNSLIQTLLPTQQ